MKTLSKIYNILIFLFLYAPIVVMIIFSFNDSKSRTVWKGFTTKWYAELFGDQAILDALLLSFIIAILAAIISTVIGAAAAIGLKSMNVKLRNFMMSLNNIPMVNPEIVTGVSLMLLFVVVYRTTGLLQPGFGTVLLSHITFCVPYVILSIMPKLRQMNPYIYEAAQDLGCPPARAFMKVVVPEIMPGIITGMMMAFTLSLDDFIISYFTSGSSAQTLPVVIYSMTRKRVSPKINALSTILFLIVLFLLVIINFRQIRDSAKEREKEQVKG
ncbi:MAG: ABC transporter permease [Oscillospiraceae bacterium]|jgi:spermidine/putrescine transport system permease protein|nr:ABC transporter permease [Oscillospiraceae bacterium]